MNKLINYSGHSPYHFSVAVFLILVTAACDAASQEAIGGQTERSISVTGTGRAEVASDVAVLRLGVETQAASALAAMEQNSEHTQALLAALKAQGVEEKYLKTESITLRPRYDYSQDKRGEQIRQLLGYTATNIVSARISNLDRVGTAVDAAIGAGGNRVDSIQFDIADPTEVLRVARDAAWQNALAQAQQLAELAGAKLGQVVSIESYQNSPGPVHNVESRALRSATPVQGGQQQLSVQVNVKWALRELTP